MRMDKLTQQLISLLAGSFVFLVFYLPLVSNSNIIAQEDCVVKMESLKGSYEGKCKKGLADGYGVAVGMDKYEGYFKKGLPEGKGKYIWENGTYYEGEWQKGKMDGEGKMVSKKDDQREEIIKGFWEKGEYIGLYRESYDVFNKSSNITNIDFSLLNNTKNEISLVLFSGKQLAIDRISVTPTIGLYKDLQQTGNSVILTNVEFPIRAFVNMPQYNFDFVINRSGNWRIRIEVDLEFSY